MVEFVYTGDYADSLLKLPQNAMLDSKESADEDTFDRAPVLGGSRNSRHKEKVKSR